MMNLEFSIFCPVKAEKLIEMATDYENIDKFFPPQMKCHILKRENGTAVLEQELSISVLKQKITQQSIHRVLSSDLLETEIISGPAKGTIVKAIYEQISSGTKVTVVIDLKVSLKYRFLIPLIKKWYKMILTGILFKMNAIALNS